MLGYIISDKEEINVEEHEIKSFDILHKTDLNIFVVENNEVLYKNNIISEACECGHVKVLDWFKKSGYEFKNPESYIISEVCYYGHVQILEWLKNNNYNINYSIYSINFASGNGHIQILEFFNCNKYNISYDLYAIIYACSGGHIQILEWFKKYGYRFKYSYVIKKCINIISLNFFFKNIHNKKFIEWSKVSKFKINKFKTKTNYIKGYNKN
jgi:hypothetical protein